MSVPSGDPAGKPGLGAAGARPKTEGPAPKAVGSGADPAPSGGDGATPEAARSPAAGRAAGAGPEVEAALVEARRSVESALTALLEGAQDPARPGGEQIPTRLAEALRYALLGPGKRLRPILTLWTCQALGGSAEAAQRPALALECLHTYSLVHDDLPAMDDDDLRRGRPTCHVVFGEALAILVGDGLQALAFELLGQAGPRAGEMVLELARASGAAGMVGGQVLDLYPADRLAGLAGVRHMHALKTGRLFEAALVLGALAADPGGRAPAGRLEQARRLGRSLGRLFQAIDDVLDGTASAEQLGKTPGKDQQRGRDNLVEHLGLEQARREAEQAAEEARQAARTLLAGQPASDPARGGPAAWLMALPLALLARGR